MSLRLRTACTRLAASALALMFGTSTLLADVTPEQVWQSWKQMVGADDATVTAQSVQRHGDTLVVDDITIEGAQTSYLKIPSISFKDRGDGTVAVILPETTPLKLRRPYTPGTGLPQMVDFGLILRLPGATFLVSGVPDAMNVKSNVPDLELGLKDVAGIPSADVDLMAVLKMTGLTVTYNIGPGTKKIYKADYAAKTVKLVFQTLRPEAGVDIGFDIADLSAGMDATVPAGVPFGDKSFDLTAALPKGFAIDVKAALGATTFHFTSRGKIGGGALTAAKPGEVSGALAKASARVAVDATRLAVDLDSTNGTVNVAGTEIPLAGAGLSYSAIAGNLLMPTAESPRPAPFAVGLTLTDIAVPEQIWATIDPTGALPHAPASLVLDAGGKMTMRHSPFLNPKSAAHPPVGEEAADLNTLDIANLNLKALGAEVTALGGLTMDYGTPGHALNPPVPSGKIDLKATGLGKLIDGLVKMGAITAQDAVPARMMLAIFAISSTTADAQTSTVEFRDAHLFVNGQKVQ